MGARAVAATNDDPVSGTRARVRSASDAVPERGAEPFVRSEIRASWDESAGARLRPDLLEPRYVGHPVRARVLKRAVEPVLGQLATELADSDITLVVCDNDGVVVSRHIPNDSERRRLDSLRLAPGFTWALDSVGTTAFGFVPDGGSVAVVAGAEHFMDALVGLTTMSGAIGRQGTRRVAGRLVLVSPGTSGGTLLAAFLKLACREIDRHLGAIGLVRRDLILHEALTNAETRLVELVARGLTNREVAAELFVSRHTVDAHLRRVYRKLNISSRVELAAVVAGQDSVDSNGVPT
jgi:DNA-binding CsgD family transcriptional regulator